MLVIIATAINMVFMVLLGRSYNVYRDSVEI
jgi:hypothetical protein